MIDDVVEIGAMADYVVGPDTRAHWHAAAVRTFPLLHEARSSKKNRGPSCCLSTAAYDVIALSLVDAAVLQ